MEKLKRELLKAIETEVKASFELEEVRAMTFTEFFNEVDLLNAYEEGWNPNKYKAYFREVYNRMVMA